MRVTCPIRSPKTPPELHLEPRLLFLQVELVILFSQQCSNHFKKEKKVKIGRNTKLVLRTLENMPLCYFKNVKKIRRKV